MYLIVLRVTIPKKSWENSEFSGSFPNYKVTTIHCHLFHVHIKEGPITLEKVIWCRHLWNHV